MNDGFVNSRQIRKTNLHRPVHFKVIFDLFLSLLCLRCSLESVTHFLMNMHGYIFIQFWVSFEVLVVLIRSASMGRGLYLPLTLLSHPAYFHFSPIGDIADEVHLVRVWTTRTSPYFHICQLGVNTHQLC